MNFQRNQMTVSLLLTSVAAFILNVLAQGMVTRRLALIYSIMRLILDANTCGTEGSTLMVLHNSDLQSINNCTVFQGSLYLQAQWDATALTLPPSLHTITGGLVCNGSGSNPSTNMITAPGLTSISSNDSSPISKLGFLITGYPNVTTLSFPILNTVRSAFTVTGNSRLMQIDGFQSLTQVGGDLTIKGDFYILDLPSLTSVNGNIDVETSADNFTCPISQLQSSVAAHGGNFVCSGNIKQANPTPSLGTSSVTASMSSPSSTSSSSASSSSGWVQSYVKILNISKLDNEAS